MIKVPFVSMKCWQCGAYDFNFDEYNDLVSGGWKMDEPWIEVNVECHPCGAEMKIRFEPVHITVNARTLRMTMP